MRLAGKAARDCQGMSEVICRRGWGRGEKLNVEGSENGAGEHHECGKCARHSCGSHMSGCCMKERGGNPPMNRIRLPIRLV